MSTQSEFEAFTWYAGAGIKLEAGIRRLGNQVGIIFNLSINKPVLNCELQTEMNPTSHALKHIYI
jgi:hypothetical protein